MAAGQRPLKTLVLVGLGGAGLFLCLRLRRAEQFGSADWLTAGGIFLLGALLALASRSKPAAEEDEDSETPASPGLLGQGKGLLWIILLPLLLWALYGGSLGPKKEEANDLIRATQTPRVIRNLAGEPDETGWVPARSVAGGFFVRVPDSFTEAVTALKLNGRLTPVVIVGVGTEEARFVALAAKWDGGEKDLKTRVKSAAKTLCRFTDPGVFREDLFDGRFPLIEIEGNAGEVKGFARVIATDRAVYGLEVEGSELTDNMREAAKRFFDSFAIVAPEPNEAVIRDAIEREDPNQ